MGSNPMTRTIGLTLPVKAHHYERIESNVLNTILLILRKSWEQFTACSILGSNRFQCQTLNMHAFQQLAQLFICVLKDLILMRKH